LNYKLYLTRNQFSKTKQRKYKKLINGLSDMIKDPSKQLNKKK